ncbi:MAG: tyrosine-type recombinase/integrase [Enterocloster bolteae]
MRIACGTDIRDNTVLELFLATGCRVSEVVGMHVEDIDLVAGCVKVLGKGQKEEDCVFPERAAGISGAVFGRPKNGAVILSRRAPSEAEKENAFGKHNS